MLRILVPVDLTENGLKACNYAIALCQQTSGATVLLLHCYQDYLEEPQPDELTITNLTPSEIATDRVLNRNHTEASEQLEALYHALQKTHRQIRFERVLMYGLPEDIIPEEVARF
ncbi:MAG TPA: universal stress protein, partial [Pontibacter sp.]